MITDAQKGVATDTASTDSGAGNAVITYTAIAAPTGNTKTTPRTHVISGIIWSYGGTPTVGNVTVKDGTTVIFQMDITTGGPGFIHFSPHKSGTAGNSMTITLADGNSGGDNDINVEAHYLMSP